MLTSQSVIRCIAAMVVLLVCFGMRLDAVESVCLKSGFCLPADSHRMIEGTLVVQSGSGTLQFPGDQVESIQGLPTSLSKAEAVGLKPAEAVLSSEELLIQAAVQEGLEPGFVRSVAMVESGLLQNALSPKGALGLMQLMPGTAVLLRVDPAMAGQNAIGGAAYLRQLLLKYNGDSVLALAAYNAGPGAVDKYKGVPPYVETRRYILKVLKEYQRQQRLETAVGGADVRVSGNASRERSIF